ncbi:ABC transporter permease [Streptomyces sp. NPDC093228]|uniref:ABC transporter permease n=1 Tax=Streptomyces sp. NPDC093228 TaxID=3155070 RepID=UPI00343BB468
MNAQQSIKTTRPPTGASADAATLTAAHTQHRRPWGTVIATVVLAAWILVALFWTHLAPYNPQAQDLTARFVPPGGHHLLGTDQFGRDTLSRLMAGAGTVLLVAPLATVLALIVGTVLGLLAGTMGRWLDEVIMRILDAVLVFPAIIATIICVAMLGHSATAVVLVVGSSFIPLVTRSVRAATLVERRKPYAEAALLRGEPIWSLMTRELLPNIAGTVLVEATSRLGDAIFAVATLSFLGLGQPPGSPDWGTAVSDNRAWLQNAPWTVLAPALAIASLVICVALISDDVRARWDSR